MYAYIHIHISTYTYTHVYIYIYIYTHVISVKPNPTSNSQGNQHDAQWMGRAPTHAAIHARLSNLAQDKGDPSKGGFLNNRSLSYMDLYLCNEFHGMGM